MKLRYTACLLLVIPAAPPAATAAEGPHPLLPPALAGRLLTQVAAPVSSRPPFRAGFAVDASDGYRIEASTSGSGVVLQVSRGRRWHRTSTAYVARGVARPEILRAAFGNLGWVSMRFRPSRNRTWHRKHRSCRGISRFVRRRGVFVGNLRFRGEQGYASIRIHRAKGSVVTVAGRCRQRSRSRRLSALRNPFLAQPPASVLASGREGVDSTAFLALESKHGTLYFAGREESHGRLAIIRFALARSPRPLRINEALTAARLSPPRPFHGTGRYSAGPQGEVRWNGDLSVDFPGAPRVPLAGPGFEVSLEAPF